MSKQIIFILGTPYSGKTTWINKNILSGESVIIIDANVYSGLYTNSKLSDDSIELSRLWCLSEVKENMEKENPIQQIVLSLIACRPDRWREFIQLANDNEYEIYFKTPSNKLLYYNTKHNTTMEQQKFIESKVIGRYPRDKKEVKKVGTKNPNELVLVDTNESSLLKYIIIELESAVSFLMMNKISLGTDKLKWINKINEQYKTVININIKRSDKKNEREAIESEKITREAEKLAKQVEKIILESKEQETTEDVLLE